MKIADFGLARGVHHIDYYKKTSNVREAGPGGADRAGPAGRGGADTDAPPSLPGSAACQVDGTRGPV